MAKARWVLNWQPLRANSRSFRAVGIMVGKQIAEAATPQAVRII
jgi:hypothetical protein